VVQHVRMTFSQKASQLNEYNNDVGGVHRRLPHFILNDVMMMVLDYFASQS
jgi:hypothetical protein